MKNLLKIHQKLITNILAILMILATGRIITALFAWFFYWEAFSIYDILASTITFILCLLFMRYFDIQTVKCKVVKSYSQWEFATMINESGFISDFAYICINDYEHGLYTSCTADNVLNIYALSDLSVEIEDNLVASDDGLQEIIDFIERNKTKKAILIHCGLGLSRSVAIEKYCMMRFNLIDDKQFDAINVEKSKTYNKHIYDTMLRLRGLKL